MASADPGIKSWSSGSDNDHKPNDEDNDSDKLSFSDLGVPRPENVKTTFFGKRRQLSTLTPKEWCFGVISVLSILAAMGLTIERIVNFDKGSEDVIFAMVLLLTLVFCLIYVINGIFGERPYELLIFIVGTLILMIYCIVNYVQTPGLSKSKLARLVIIGVMGPINIGLGAYFAREYYLSRNLIFRTVGANLEIQDLCSRVFLTESLFRFDLQLELTLVILVMKSGVMDLSTLEIVVLAVGLVYSFLWFILGLVAISRENKYLVFLVLAFSWCEPAYIIYKFVDVGMSWTNDPDPDPSDTKLIPAAIILAGVAGLVVRAVLCGFFFYVYRNFGRGMKEKAFGVVGGSSPSKDSADEKEPENGEQVSSTK